MDPIAKSLPATRRSTPSTAALTRFEKPSAERLAAARDCLKLLLKGRPDTNAENPQYLAEMVECLGYLSDDELATLANPRDGLQTVCKFLPTPADVHGFLRERRERLEAVRPASTTYRRLNGDDAGPWDQETDFERKKRVVEELLGYNPDERGRPAAKRIFTPPSTEEVANLNLKTPAAPPSASLISLLKQQGWPFIPQAGGET